MIDFAAQVALTRWRRTDVDRFIRFANVRGSRVCIAVHSDGADAKLMTRADDAERDFAAIGDENFFEHPATAKEGCCRASSADSGRAFPSASRARRSGAGACRAGR